MSDISPHLRTQLGKGPKGEPVLVLHVAETPLALDEKQMDKLRWEIQHVMDVALDYRQKRERRGQRWMGRAP